MSDPNHSTLTERMQRLERQLLFTRIWALALSVIVCGLGIVNFESGNRQIKAPPAVSMNSVAPAASPQIIKATEFVVVDSHGNQLASLGQSYDDPTYAKLAFVFHPFSKSENFGVANDDNIGSWLTVSDLGIDFYDYYGKNFAHFDPEGTMHPSDGGQSFGLEQPMEADLGAGQAELAGSLTMGDMDKNSWVSIDNDSVTIWQNGPRAILGVAQLTNPTTGGQTTTAPSRLTLFDTKGNVIWHDPYP